jgi:hypothetical protein
MWRRSREWTDQALQKSSLDGEDCTALETARSLLDTLGWDTAIHGPWTTFDLSIILSNAWLLDDHIDMMMADLSARVAANSELATKILIAPLAFSQAIKNGVGKNYQRKDTPLLARYEEHIKQIGLIELHFPIHIHGNHWIAGVIDFKQNLIGTGTSDKSRSNYIHLPISGDSRVKLGAAPTKFIKDLKRWLQKQFRKNFTYQGDSLEHGDQRDTSSCAIVTRNTVAVNVFGEAVWEQERAADAQASCFVRLVRSAAIREMVSNIFFCVIVSMTDLPPATCNPQITARDHSRNCT